MRNPIFILTFCLFFCGACSMFLESEEAPGTGLKSQTQNQLNSDDLENYQAPYFLDSAYIKGTELWIEVSFSGGCREHDFIVVWPEVITMIYPPDFGISLHHSNKGDNCEALITDTLKIDLRETPIGEFNATTISEMRITVVNGSDPERSKSTAKKSSI